MSRGSKTQDDQGVEATRMFTVRLPASLHDALETAASLTGRTVADVLRESAYDWLSGLDLDKMEVDLAREATRRTEAMRQAVENVKSKKVKKGKVALADA